MGVWGKTDWMQILARCGCENVRPSECRKCGSRVLHRHGTYERWVVLALNVSCERIEVDRYLCVDCRRTTSVLPWGLISYRLLSIFILIESLFDLAEQRYRDLLEAYRRRWKAWYPRLWRGIGNLYGKPPINYCDGWQKLGDPKRNWDMVDKTGWSLFGLYAIHKPIIL
jgi:hypothetical protein